MIVDGVLERRIDRGRDPEREFSSEAVFVAVVQSVDLGKKQESCPLKLRGSKAASRLGAASAQSPDPHGGD